MKNNNGNKGSARSARSSILSGKHTLSENSVWIQESSNQRAERAGIPKSPEASPIRLLLGATASAYLAELGDCFVVIGKASTPDAGRYAIHLVPTTVAQADAAVRVAIGQSTERKTKSPTTTKTQ